MKIFNKRKYYDFLDLIKISMSDAESSTYWDLSDDEFLSMPHNILGWSDQSYSTGYGNNKNVFKWDTGDAEWLFASDSIQALVHIIWSRNSSNYIFSIDEDEDAELNFHLAKFASDLINLMNITAPRYLALLNAYQEKKDDLLSKLKGSTHAVTRFNDTPQNAGDFEDEEYATNVTIGDVSTENDPMTAMERIREIDESYNNLLLIWANEFNRLFLRRENV